MQLKDGLAAVLLTTQLDALAQVGSREPDAADASAYDVAATYTADLWRNASGGLRTGGAYLDNLDLTLSIDGERAFGLPGLSAFAYVLYNNDARFSERYVGDAMTASNIDAAQAVRLYEAWLEWAHGEGQRLSMRFGLYDLNSEFDTSESRSLFIHSGHGVGHELGQTGGNGPSIFPVTSLGLRLAWNPVQDWRILAAILDGVPGDREVLNRSGIHLSGDEGALAITEAQWSNASSGGRISKLSLGRWRYTAESADVRSTERAPLPERDDNRGTYAAIEFALGRVRWGEPPATSAFVRYGRANGRINEFEEYLGVGVRRRAPVASRPHDEFGVAISWAGLSKETRAAAISAGTRRERYEAALELTYRAPVNDWLTLQPDVQFIFHPGADPTLSDALALGLRFEFAIAAFL